MWRHSDIYPGDTLNINAIKTTPTKTVKRTKTTKQK
jgi:hypothetical protein